MNGIGSSLLDSVGDFEDDHEQQQLEGFMMMYELVRPICRTNIFEETLRERKMSKIENLLTTLRRNMTSLRGAPTGPSFGLSETKFRTSP